MRARKMIRHRMDRTSDAITTRERTEKSLSRLHRTAAIPGCERSAHRRQECLRS